MPSLRLMLVGAVGLGSAVAAVAPMSALAAPSEMTRASVADGTDAQADASSSDAVPSLDGRYVAFQSNATNLVTGDTNGSSDVFLRDTQTGATTRVSVADGTGAQAIGGNSFDPAVSANGQMVAFDSEAPNLVPGDMNAVFDIFIRNTVTGATTRVSVDSAGSEANGHSFDPVISSDGRYVAFYSEADNLVAGDGNGSADAFLHDTQTGATTRVSVADSTGAEANDSSTPSSISFDGRFVAFDSGATNLVVGDTNADFDVFVRDTQNAETTRVSVDSAGAEATADSFFPQISANGRYVAFYSAASDLVPSDTNGVSDVFVHDRQTGATTRVSVDSAGAEATGGIGGSSLSSISGGGRYVAFESSTTNLVREDTNDADDVFVHDRQTGGTHRVSVSGSGSQGDLDSNRPRLSLDGSAVAFESAATNLVAGESNATRDVFVDEFDIVEPSLVATSPADNAAGVAIGTDLELTFDEDVAAGAGDITLRNSGVVEQFAAGSPRVSFSGRTVTIDPSDDLAFATSYFVQVEPGAITDTVGNPFGGITDASSWNFTSEPAPAPTPAPPPAPAPAPPAPAAAPPPAPTSGTPTCRLLRERSEGEKGEVRLGKAALRIQQNQASAGLRRLNAVNALIDSGIEVRDLCLGAFGPGAFQPGIGWSGGAVPQELVLPNPRELEIAKKEKRADFTADVRQTRINLRIALALRERAEATLARIAGGLTGGNLAAGVTLTPGHLYPGLAATSLPPPAEPAAAELDIDGVRLPKRVRYTRAQMKRNQAINISAIKTANEAIDRFEAGLLPESFAPGSIGANRVPG